MSNKLQFVEMLINEGFQQTEVCWTLLNLTPLTYNSPSISKINLNKLTGIYWKICNNTAI